MNGVQPGQPPRKWIWLAIPLGAVFFILIASSACALFDSQKSADPTLAIPEVASPAVQLPIADPETSDFQAATQVQAAVQATLLAIDSPTPFPTYTEIPALLPTQTQIPTNLPTEPSLQKPAIPVIGGADKIALLNNNDIWISNLDGSDLIELTKDGVEKSSLQWSPDGLAVHYILGMCIKSVDIQTLRIDDLACFDSADSLEAFEISLDGQRVAISLDRELFILPYDQKKISQAKSGKDLQAMADCEILAPYSHNDKVIVVKSARWSRDGKQIAIVRKGFDNAQQVDLVDLLDIAKCTASIDLLDEFPATRFKMKDYAVSPIIENLAWDGRYLFVLNSFKRNNGFGDLWIYSTEAHRAYQTAPIEEGCCYRDPVWSPDGSHLLFVFQDMSKTPENVIKLYYVAYASLGTGMKYAPLPLPADFFTDPRAKPMPALRPAP